MKTFYKIMFIILLGINSVFPQFNLQSSNTTNDLRSVYFVNQDVGFIAGFQSILKTTDGGITWVSKYSGAAYLYYIKFFSNTIGLAIGFANTNTIIMKTTNGGENWSQVGSYIYTVDDFYFVSPDIGWIVNYGQILKTTDAGTNWTSQYLGLPVETIYMLNENIGWAVGRSNAQVRTTNGGSNWVSTPLPFYPSKILTNVFFYNSSLGWIVGEGDFIAQTYNGGLNWAQQNVSESTDFYDVFFTSDLDGWACGRNRPAYNGILWKTTNSGNNWTKETIPTMGYLQSIWSSDPNNVWVVGNGGKILSNAKRIYLTSPNGGNTWQMGSNQTITWKYFNISNIKIELSTNSGTDWTTLAPSVPASSNSYSFTVPNSPSSNCRIRISDASNPATNDISESNFTIQGIIIQSPNGYEVWDVNSIQTITWISAGLTNIKIDYTTDNGNTWTQVIGSTSAQTSAYNWSVPNNPSNNCKVRLTSLENSNLLSTSNNLFIIRGIKVSSPNGGENWVIGTTKNVIWTSGGLSQVNIEYTLNNGTDWNVIINSTPANSGSYSWTIPNTPSTQCKVRISDASNNTIVDESDNVFTISEAPSITVSSPIAGSIWVVGTVETINWSSINVTGNVNIKLSTDGGNTFPSNLFLVNNTANDGTQDIAVPNAPSTSCRIRIESSANINIFGLSDGDFTIVAPSVQVTSPNGGEVYDVGSSQQITWNSQYVSDIKIEYTINNGGSWILIDSSYNSSGNYNWLIPNTPSSQCKIRISNKINPIFNDLSDNVFTIRDTTSTGIENFLSSIPKEFALHQNFPNPFNPTTRIYYSVPKESQVTIKIYNTIGEELTTLVDEIKSTGNYSTIFNASHLQSGVYIYRMKAGDFVAAKKMLIVK